MTVVLVAASVEVKIELNESTAPAAIKMLKVRIVIPPNIFYRAIERPTINVGHHSQFPTLRFRGRIERFGGGNFDPTGEMIEDALNVRFRG